jgi:hypothetical protein
MTMEEVDDDSAHYLSLSPHDYYAVERLEVVQVHPRNSPDKLEVKIVFGKGLQGTPHLVLTFSGVTECRFQSTSLIQFVSLQITSIRDRHWEGLHYIVHDAENDDLYLLCDTFTAELFDDLA